MSREQSLRNGAGLMVFGALIFLVYAVVFFFRAFANGGFEVGVETLNGVTSQQLDGRNPAIMGYITHLHVAIAGFIAATAIAAGGLAWYGVRNGLWWAWTGRDRAHRGIGRGVATALHGAFQLQLGEPPRADLRWDHHLRCGGCGGADRAEPSGARRSTSRALKEHRLRRSTQTAACSPGECAHLSLVDQS
jgi:hypothetical protein